MSDPPQEADVRVRVSEDQGLPDDDELDRALGPKARAVMNGPQYTQRAKGRTWENDEPAPQDP